jgi:hypothetical protein
MVKTSDQEEIRSSNDFINKYGSSLFIAPIVIYIVLLVTGLMAELFDIQPILDWWIWSPPGR